MDVWQKIVARTAKIERDHAIAEGKRKAAAAKHKKEMDEVITIVLMLLIFLLVCGGVGWIVYKAVQECGGRC
jgi:preprotein translocase subunit Sss1